MQTMTLEEFQAAMKAQGVPIEHVAVRCPRDPAPRGRRQVQPCPMQADRRGPARFFGANSHAPRTDLSVQPLRDDVLPPMATHPGGRRRPGRADHDPQPESRLPVALGLRRLRLHRPGTRRSRVSGDGGVLHQHVNAGPSGGGQPARVPEDRGLRPTPRRSRPTPDS